MHKYSVRATNNDSWRKKNICEIGISLGNPCHEGLKLQALLEWAGKNFDTCVITLSDTLYRYNLMAGGMSDAQAYMTSKKMGDIWLAENHKALVHTPTLSPVIKRWDDWLSSPEYEKTFSEVRDFYNVNKLFKNAIHKDVKIFTSRRAACIDSEKLYRFEETSRQFLLEELAVYILIARHYQALRVYPARDMECFKFLREYAHLPNNLKGLELAPHLDVNFKRKGSSTLNMAA